MSLPKWSLSIAHAVLVLATPLVLVFAPLYVLVTPGFVHQEYRTRGFPPADIYTPAERIRLSDPILRYLRGHVTRAELAAVRTDAGSIALLDEEVQHLADVKGVMDRMFLVQRVALALAVVCAALLWVARQRRAIRAGLRQGVAIVGVLVGLVMLSSFINFDVFFTRFHEMFFKAGTWTFYAEDTLIQLYPLPLWMHAAYKYGALVLVAAALAYALSFCFRDRATPTLKAP
jgi:integral membrane protein (TIGR01906 family)